MREEEFDTKVNEATYVLTDRPPLLSEKQQASLWQNHVVHLRL